MAWDIERGAANEVLPQPWQTYTCIGSWHYDKGIFDRHRYKTAKNVVQMLIDIVSKNGNLLLSVPLTGEGVPDSDELEIVEGIAKWMEVNQEAIHGTRPWKVFGEGPQMASAAPIQAQGFNEGRGKPFTAEDARFTSKGDTLYAFIMGTATNAVSIKSLGKNSKLVEKPVSQVELLGSSETLQWSQTPEALVIQKPQNQPNNIAIVFKNTPRP